VGAVLNLEDLPQDMPSAEDIHYWTHGDDDKDDLTVRRMLDLPEDAEEPEDAGEDYEEGQHLYWTVTGQLDP